MSLESNISSLKIAVDTLTSVAQTLDTSTQAAYNQAVSTATTKAENAADSALDALDHATLSSQWATKTDGAVSGGEYSAKYHAQAANTSAGAAAGSAASALAIYGNTTAMNNALATSTSNATTATTKATEATAARDAAIAASQVATAPTENLTAIARSIHYGAIVDVALGDVSKDSDPLWVKRCADKSWYKEAATVGCANWLGQYATEALARAATDATTNSYFQATSTSGSVTSGKFYKLNAGSGVTEVFRGKDAEFPQRPLVVAESARVIIYDADSGAMWRSFPRQASTIATVLWAWNSVVATGVAILNGQLVLSSTTGSNSGRTSFVNFITERGETRGASQNAGSVWPIADHLSPVTNRVLYASGYLATNDSNDVAMTVLPGAPIDPATGLAAPTTLVATAGGLSWIMDSGVVWDSALTTGYDFKSCDIKPNGYSVAATTSTVYVYNSLPTADGKAASMTFGAATVPAISGTVDSVAWAGDDIMVVTSTGLFRIQYNPAVPAASMVTQVSHLFNSGYQVGAIKGAWLSDSVAVGVSAVTRLNETFDTDVDAAGFAAQYPGWGSANSAVSVVGGKLRVTGDGTSSYPRATFALTELTPGATYSVSCSAVAPGYQWYPEINGVYGSSTSSTNTFTSFSFTAPASSLTLQIVHRGAGAGPYVDFDNISVKLAEPNRSNANQGLIVNGNITKRKIDYVDEANPGTADLVAYSGFSAGNYLEQPYNSALDFGAGDFCVMGWVNRPSSTVRGFLFDRGTVGGGRIALDIDTSFNYSCSATAGLVYTGVAIGLGLHHICFLRVSGVLYIYLDGVSVYSIANTANVSNTSAAVIFGVASDRTTLPFTVGSLALWRISATAPSADQIAQIYAEELPLFQPGAKALLAGTSSTVTALCYDQDTDTVHATTSYGRTAFRNLLQVESEATVVGTPTAVTALGGTVVTGGSTSGYLYTPAKSLKDELNRQEEAAKALGQVPVFFDHTATASQTAFVAPKGYTIKALYKNGTLMREATSGTYWTRSYDGFAETATLSVGASASDWISLMCVRSI